MATTFYKYQGTGNDFVMIDNRDGRFFKKDARQIERICDRRFGIGADGLILLENDPDYDFRMVYYNSDGNESSMCGNGGRCLVAFAKKLGVIVDRCRFIAVDGSHEAEVLSDDTISLKMKDVDSVRLSDGYVFLDTGSPHHVEMVDDVNEIDVKDRGAEIRYSNRYGVGGTNVNFVTKLAEDQFSVRTYERGVEDETLSCGTGVTAVAIAMNELGHTNSNQMKLKVLGGELGVSFNKNDSDYTDVWLSGPAQFVFSGEIAL